MDMTSPAQTVLTEVSVLAAGQSWSPVTEFLGALPASTGRGILVAAGPGVDPGPLAAWIVAQDDRASCEVTDLERLQENPGLTLAANRVVVALQCGELLMPGTVSAAAAVRQRPSGTFAIVLTGAEVIESPEELEMVERAIWRVLIGPEGVDWAGQDLAAHHCLMWSGAEAGVTMSERLVRDHALLREWLAGEVRAPGDLARARAAYALDLTAELASQEKAEPPADAGVGPDQIWRLREDVIGLHRRLLRRLADDTGAIERQLTASLAMLEQDLLHDVEGYLDQHQKELSDPAALRQLATDFIARGVDRWRVQMEDTIRDGTWLSRRDSEQLFDGVDWDLVNEWAPRGGGGYPQAILNKLQAARPARWVAGGPGPGAPTARDAGDRDWVPAVRSAVYSGTLAAATLAVLGVALVPVAAAAVVGLVGGSLIESRQEGAQARRRARAYARAAISSAITTVTATGRDQLRETAQASRLAVDGEFTAVEEQLHEAALHVRSAAGDAPVSEGDSALNIRLAALRARLSASAGVSQLPTQEHPRIR